MGKCHAMAWTAVKGVFGDVPSPRLVMVCDIDEAAARQTAADFDFAGFHTDWRRAVDHADVDVISIAAPNAFHAEIAIAALDAGKHVWCEKPMAVALEDSERMLAAAERSGRITVVGYNYVHNPAVQHAARLARDGAIGKVQHFRIFMDEDFMADPEKPWALQSSAAAGYGVLDDFGCHTISLAHVLIGDVASVCAFSQRPYPTRPDAGAGAPRAVENEDIATSLLRFENGVMGSMSASRANWGRKGRLEWEIHGSGGTILFNQERMNELRLFTADTAPAVNGFRTIFTGPYHEPYGAFCPAPGHNLGFNDQKVIEARNLLHAITGKAEPVYDFARALKVERVVHAMARSAREACWVDV